VLVALGLDQHIENLALSVDGPPEICHPPIDLQIDFVKMLSCVRLRGGIALKAAGAARVYRETASGAKVERRELGRALKSMTAGDTLLVTRLDRLARSTRDLLNILDAVAKAGAGFRSLADIWADGTTPHGRLMLTSFWRPRRV
jgi:hypothetical protein